MENSGGQITIQEEYILSNTGSKLHMLNDIADRQNIQNWASLVRYTLANLGFFEVWLAQGVGNMNKFLLILKQRLADNFLQNWSERLEASSRASFYKHIFISIFR